MKRIDIKEFQEKGYLQEVNRRFLHPLGLALEIVQQENGDITLGGIWDSREDEEGIYYDLKNSKEDRIERFEKNMKFIDSEIDKKSSTRIKILGEVIEPIKK